MNDTPISPAIVREFAPTGRLRAALNMGNPVLAHSRTSKESPAGVTIDLSREFAKLLGVEVEFQQFDSAGQSGDAVANGTADVAFLAVDPKRAERLHFTAPYVQIEGCYLVRDSSPIRANDEVDQPGIRVLVGLRSAYALHLERALAHAQLVNVPTSEEVVKEYLARPEVQVAAGVRQQLMADAQREGGARLLPGRFMVIHQAMATGRDRSSDAIVVLEAFIAEQKRSGFVAGALTRHGIEGADVAS